jgi:ABC-type lipoprotein release transport system permease subunit
MRASKQSNNETWQVSLISRISYVLLYSFERERMSSNRTSLWISLATLATGMALLVGFVTVSNGQVPNQRTEKLQAGPNVGHSWKASELIGLSVHNSGDEEKGKIKDLMIGPDGRVDYAAVSFGGFLGFGDKLFAVPLDAIHLEWKDNKISRARVDVTEESIKQRQGFDDKHWPEHADRGFIMNEAARPNGRTPPANH